MLAQPSLVEPLGQALLEAMACGRSVVATRIGGPPEFVPPEAGVLVDPLDVDALARALEQAAALPCPNDAAREATAEHDVRRQAERIEAILSRAAAQIREPDLDERPDPLLEPGLPRERERLLPALARLRRVDALLEPVVARHEQLLDPLVDVLFHKATLTGRMNGCARRGKKPKPLRVLIADDHRLFAEALQAILATDERIEVVGQASDGSEAVELARTLGPDVVLMDVSMPVLDGFEATREIRAASEDVRVLMLTGSNSRADVDRSREAGASGYVTKDRIASELVAAIVEVTRRRLP